MTYFLGIDLGGTNIKTGVVDDNGVVVAKHSQPTESRYGADRVLKNMVDAAKTVVDAADLTLKDIAYIGIGSPGPVDAENGIVISSPNLAGWSNYPMRNLIAQALGRPTTLANDANAAAFGEFWVGAGSSPDIQNLIMITLGTGVGGGVIVNGQIIGGTCGYAAEIGHIIVQPDGRECGCGQKGCLETYASASRTAVRACEMLAKGKSSTLQAIYKADPQQITAKAIFDAAAAGDELANNVIDQTAYYLALACISLTRVLDPQMFVFAGGMAMAGDALLSRIKQHFDAQNWHAAPNAVSLEIAQLGNDAGLIGAAAIAWDANRND
jgi:glucokinase